MFRTTVRLTLIAVALIATTLLSAPRTQAAVAATFNVNSSLDETDNNLGDNLCNTASNVCTLRAAIQQANDLGGSNTINLPATYSPYVLTRNFASEDNAVSGDLDLTSDITLTGDAAATTVIDANGIDRVFELFAANVTIQKVTIRGGFLYSHGGGVRIHADGKLTLKRSIVTANYGGTGGGIYVEPDGELVTVNTTFDANEAQIAGGLAVLDGKATLKKSTIQNHVMLDPSASTAAGAYVSSLHGTGVLKLVKSSVKNNQIQQGVAGIYAYGKLTLTQSTVSGNVTPDTGGGIYMTLGTLQITNSTISGNTAAQGAGLVISEGVGATDARISSTTITENEGGGILLTNGSGKTKIRNTIIALNRIDSVSLTADDCDGTFHSWNNNLIGDLTNCVLTGATSANIIGLDPQLGILQNNGGLTETHLPANTSPVIDAGKSGGCKNAQGAIITADQRADTRPIDGDSDGTATCDIGSVEVQ